MGDNRRAATMLSRLRRFLMGRFRPGRRRLFAAAVGLQPGDRIVDVGGYVGDWAGVDPGLDVLVVNLEPVDERHGNVRKIQGDGRRLQFPDRSFDIAFSNSVIEHVGGWEDQVAFAREIARIAPSYFVQTPNRWFPVEPHTLAPFIHFLPRAWQPPLVRWLGLWGLATRPDPPTVRDFLDGIRLLDASDMRRLFPDTEIVRERFLGMTKSLIAIRTLTRPAAAPPARN